MYVYGKGQCAYATGGDALKSQPQTDTFYFIRTHVGTARAASPEEEEEEEEQSTCAEVEVHTSTFP
jgi:hypothetical protein